MTYEIYLKSGKSFICSPDNLNIDKHAIEMYDKNGIVIAFISMDSIEALTVVEDKNPSGKKKKTTKKDKNNE